MPVNYQERGTKFTALHAAAATGARMTARLLLETGKCDHLLRDFKGRLPSELANLYGNDPALAHLLGIKERKQGDREGIRVTRRPIPAP
ncbi:hypothetical protein GCM10027428_35430 [Haliea atlantica]